MLTAFYDPKRRSWAFRDGAADFLLKRFEVEEISERIRDACRQPFGGGRMTPPLDPEGMPESSVISNQYSVISNFSDWPERRAPGTMGQRHRGDDISEASTGRGRSNVHSRSVARGLARGVRYLRVLMNSIF
jgi:DNA-binding response OmpR family regulator